MALEVGSGCIMARGLAAPWRGPNMSVIICIAGAWRPTATQDLDTEQGVEQQPLLVQSSVSPTMQVWLHKAGQLHRVLLTTSWGASACP